MYQEFNILHKLLKEEYKNTAQNCIVSKRIAFNKYEFDCFYLASFRLHINENLNNEN